MNAQSVDFNLMANKHAWLLADIDKKKTHKSTVMSTFSCGGGSTMGYKLAGYDVIASNDIDPEMAWHYKKNHNPKHYFLCPIKDLLKKELPSELYNLDILDGSPPCSTFSVAGNREKDWGKLKHFREGQQKQVLDDLFFDFLALADKLQPKIIVAENVKGMLLGNAKGYTKKVVETLKEMGYRPQVFLLDAFLCNVPQKRQRVFFCAIKNTLEAPILKLNPNSKLVTCGEACLDLQNLTDEEIVETKPNGTILKYWHLTKKGRDFSEACKKLTGKDSNFSSTRLSDIKPAPTLTTQEQCYSHWDTPRKLTLREYTRLCSFPDDYTFKTHQIGKYLMGMSVPPKLMEYVASEIYTQWLKPLKLEETAK
jgi:DNA (cytosine-5)-methyltransferase 1